MSPRSREKRRRQSACRQAGTPQRTQVSLGIQISYDEGDMGISLKFLASRAVPEYDMRTRFEKDTSAMLDFTCPPAGGDLGFWIGAFNPKSAIQNLKLAKDRTRGTKLYG
jgi:hypothetical protein